MKHKWSAQEQPYEGDQKVLSQNILDNNFFHNLYIGEMCAFFTDSYESVADMRSL